MPASFEQATSDGERWRWCLAQAAELAPARLNDVRMTLAQFWQSQLGEQTLAYGGWRLGRAGDKEDTGTFALHTLAETETIARLATGIKRFTVPDEFNYIHIYQKIVDEPATGRADEAIEQLASIFENRRQYPKSADQWRRVIKDYGAGNENYRRQRLDQIVKNWGRFEPIASQPAGKGATFEYRYRNGTRVTFEAHALRVGRLLTDVKEYLRSNPAEVDWQKMQIENLGYRIVTENESRYLGEKAAEWTLDLRPRPEHVDDRVTVASPLQRAGAYLVIAKMANGNNSRMIVWVADTVIVKKRLQKSTLLYVADAATGAPLAKMNVESFGFANRQRQNGRNIIETKNLADATDDSGMLTLSAERIPQDYQWLFIARSARGRLAYLGYNNVWYGESYDAAYNATKAFAITDRPVYRPSQKVQFKFWVRQAQYDNDKLSDFANLPLTVVIQDPQGEKVLEKELTTDTYGGLVGEFPLGDEAKLGAYSLHIEQRVKKGDAQEVVANYGGGSFRVEEYKKPEYEVLVEAPTEPVMLGDKITATVKANYYFGAPVVNARVKYKVMRTAHTEEWYPVGPWDWFYGRGYWWFAYDYSWYPGFRSWGCMRPQPSWWHGGSDPPEVVAEQEVAIGADGTVKIEIDTEVAKELHGDQDHRYEITAEVIDESRRTIVGAGAMQVAREPFRVHAWVHRGYYRVGDTIQANFAAHTIDQKPVQGQGKLQLLRVSYDAQRKPVETEVQAWELATDAEGQAAQRIAAASPGQYRLSYKVNDAKSHTQEGGYVFTVIGQGFDGRSFRFDNVELIPDKQAYAPGEKVRLQINTDRAGSTVLLFVRPSNGVYLPPKLVRIAGKSTVTEIDVAKKDMPNFFVEAVTISDGRLYEEAKEIVVPPEQRVFNVAVEPSAKDYKPGEKATVKVRLTDLNGEPFVGSTVIAIYDKSVEYISGGSNVPEIKEYFWKWRRDHQPSSETSLARYEGPLFKRNEVPMASLGIFGETIVEELESSQEFEGISIDADASGGGGGTRRFRGGLPGPAAPMSAAPMDMSAEGSVSGGVEVKFAKASDQGVTQVQPTVRTNFADTALWVGSITTEKNGECEVSLDMPENLTTWKIRAWGMGAGTRVGQGEAEVITKKNLIVRLQAPRFFVEKDEVVLSANVHNYLEQEKSVEVVLELDGSVIAAPANPSQTVTIPAGGEQRVDWRVRVEREGEAVVRMKALTDEESDAIEMKFPSYVHGMLKTESFAGSLKPDENSGKITFKIPAERRAEQSRIEVRYSPTLAGAMVDALPYLVDYPHGCTEQTLNRFLPTVVTQKVLMEMQLDVKSIQEKRTNLNAQEIGDDQQRAKGWKRFDRNPVFDEAEVQKMVRDGVDRLSEMQLSDGGWGWFSGYGEHSWPHTTAVVVHGLQIAQQNDVAIVPGVLERGVEWLKTYQQEQLARLKRFPEKEDPYKEFADDLDAFVYMVLADAGAPHDEMRELIYRDRTKLSVYSLGMFGLAMHKEGQQEKVEMLLRNISQYLVQDEENQTAYLKLPNESYWWHWYGNDIEAMAYYLKLLAKTDPQGETARRLVKYLLNNRKHSTYWNSTRDTALVVESFADFLRASGETKPDMTVEVWLDGQKQKEVQITAADLFTFDNKLVLEGDAVTDGQHTVELRKQGAGPLYYNAYVTNFTLEDFITSAGLEIKVNRKFYKLNRVDKATEVAGSSGQVVSQKVEKYEREELPNLATVKSGDLIEIELEIDSKNDYEYLIFEDMKAAGFEPVDLRSGYTGNSLGAYVEFRDERAVFFARTLSRGKHSVAYRLRAEIPGLFSALPARAEAMYAPELKGNSDEMKVGVED
ncbi:MAG: MG2 domain-containing protein [Planctomycetia bacterium]|nr:MG2 domain-containing protein [Planctomycetia bacterium]